jgi:hypothetical protein
MDYLNIHMSLALRLFQGFQNPKIKKNLVTLISKFNKKKSEVNFWEKKGYHK